MVDGEETLSFLGCFPEKLDTYDNAMMHGAKPQYRTVVPIWVDPTSGLSSTFPQAT